MSESNIGAAEENLRLGLNEIGDARRPLETGIGNVNALATELNEADTALEGVLSFLEGFQERVRREVIERFSGANHHYQEAAGLIIGALEGANDDNQHVTDAKLGVAELSHRGQKAVDSLEPINDENMQKLAAHLIAAQGLMRKMNAALGNAHGWGRTIPDYDVPTSIAVQLYLEGL